MKVFFLTAVIRIFRYLYWTNAKQSNAAIERSRLDGSEHKVLINGSLSQPIGIAIDLDNDLLYWTNERGTMFYSIESSNLDGTSRRTLIHGTHHQPFSIAVGDKEVYWSDWINKIVWALPKDSFQGGVEPKEVYKYKYLAVPNGLITPTPTHINDTQCIEAKRDVSVNIFQKKYLVQIFFYRFILLYRTPCR